jgi:hypothetical protein
MWQKMYIKKYTIKNLPHASLKKKSGPKEKYYLKTKNNRHYKVIPVSGSEKQMYR